jgi:hypothetical protein
LQVAIDLLPAAKPEAGNWLLFLPENEFHETGLLLAQFLIRDSKQNTIYLGASTPLSVVQAATKKTRPDYMLLFLVHHDDSSSVQHYLDELSSNFKGRKIYVACKPSLSKINVGKKLQFLASVTDLEKILHPV